jgi:predicted DNA-binding transcriptional regulator AlpA
MPDELVGTGRAAQILGVAPREIKRLVRDRPFPEPVAWLEGRRAWLRQDIEAFRDGGQRTDREPGELQDEILNAVEVLRCSESVSATSGAVRRRPAGIWFRRPLDGSAWPSSGGAARSATGR